MYHHTRMFLGNSQICPPLKCGDYSCVLCPNLLLVHDILSMLINTQIVSSCTYCNHSSNYSHILDLKNSHGPPTTISPLHFSLFDVLGLQMAFKNHKESFFLGIHKVWFPSLEITWTITKVSMWTPSLHLSFHSTSY